MHRFQVIEDSKDAMVIGRDFLRALGITINFSNQTVQWDEHCLQINTGDLMVPSQTCSTRNM